MREPTMPSYSVPCAPKNLSQVRYPRTPAGAYNALPHISQPCMPYSVKHEPEEYPMYHSYQEPTRYSSSYYQSESIANPYLPSPEFTPRIASYTNSGTFSSEPYPHIPTSQEYGFYTQMESLIEPSEEDMHEDLSFFDEYTAESDVYPYNGESNENGCDDVYPSTPQNVNKGNRGVVCRVRRTPESIKIGEDLKNLFISINSVPNTSIDTNEINVDANEHDSNPTNSDSERCDHRLDEIKSPLILSTA
ncbi:hypothetical protein MXB_604 [Myxobolus squamalis]|nr:hypothetical protein MXB_604 [Myxobolus squamalis]